MWSPEPTVSTFTTEMLAEIECGVCYRSYNTARRAPRVLHCQHSFCERCLRAMSRPLPPPAAGRTVDCPVCRRSSRLSQLRLDEAAMERLVAAGIVEEEEEEEEDDEEEEEEARVLETETEDGDSAEEFRGGRLRRSWTKIWRKISGKSRRRADGCMTNDEMRNLAMMSCYMF